MKLTRPDGTPPEDFNLSRRGLASLLAGGYAVAAVAADAAPITTDAMGLVTETVSYPSGGTTLPAFIARPAGTGRHPTVIVVNEVFGIHEWIRDVCRRFAKLGYVAIAPQYFVRADPDNKLPDTKDFPEIIKIVRTAGYEQQMGDTGATLTWLAAQPFVDAKKIAITGFCWGGAVVWMACARFPQLKAGVAWYGQLVGKANSPLAAEPRPWPVDVAKDLKAPVLGLYGGLDKGIGPDQIEAMRAALKAAGKASDEIIVYPDAQHGFHADYRDSYNETASKDGWARLLAFFAKNGVGATAMKRAA